MNMEKINSEISVILRNDYNEVIYRAWLTFVENSELKDENLIVSVPNQYIKETFQDRFAESVEELYRDRLDFKKLIIKTYTEEVIKINSSLPLTVNSSLLDISDIVNSCIKDIYKVIEEAVKNGNKNVSCIFIKETSILEELYWRVKDFLLDRGFKTELLNSENNYTLNLSW